MTRPRFAFVLSGVAHEVFGILRRMVYPPPMVGTDLLEADAVQRRADLLKAYANWRKALDDKEKAEAKLKEAKGSHHAE